MPARLPVRRGFPWTPEAIALLARLWADRTLTTEMIGERVGCGKNAAIGKVHRLGLPPRPNTGGWKHSVRRRKTRPPVSIPRATAVTLPPLPSLDIPPVRPPPVPAARVRPVPPAPSPPKAPAIPPVSPPAAPPILAFFRAVPVSPLPTPCPPVSIPPLPPRCRYLSGDDRPYRRCEAAVEIGPYCAVHHDLTHVRGSLHA